ncbi:hypothetical protein E2C01_027332 [Portunus trituberculatus]|uniref:Uncharacterized protein n=1 Tax=Portunus trituberculatus TaxID=210409 RepID=A0A5B7EHW0_PORTR|nr:hypothetical protein [Portunus trituberculatus]
MGNRHGFIYVTSNQLGRGAAKWELGIEASVRDAFLGIVPVRLPLRRYDTVDTPPQSLSYQLTNALRQVATASSSPHVTTSPLFIVNIGKDEANVGEVSSSTWLEVNKLVARGSGGVVVTVVYSVLLASATAKATIHLPKKNCHNTASQESHDSVEAEG